MADYLKYIDYDVADFLMDDSFIEWTKNEQQAGFSFWDDFFDRYPSKLAEAEMAKYVLKQIASEPCKTKDELTKQKIWENIQLSANNRQTKFTGIRRLYIALMCAAASVLFLSILFLDKIPHNVRTETTYGEMKTVELPDGSTVTLNGNSSLWYKTGWDGQKPREVWVEGEAFFEVTHLHKGAAPVKAGDKFIVHAEGMNIEVLGTTFNVSTRHKTAKVVLKSGSIKLDFDNTKEVLMLKPGEEVKFVKDKAAIVRDTAVTMTSIGSWKEKRLEFKNTSLREVLQILKDSYGLNYEISDDMILNRTISGSVSTESVEMIIKGIAITMDLDIRKDGNILVISNR